MGLSFREQIADKQVALALSAGYFGFYHQAGVLLALEELGIRPKWISGNSAGALVASMYAAGMDPPDIGEALLALRREDFWDLQWPITRLGIGLLAGERFRAELGRVLPCHSFENCRFPLSVGVCNIDTGRVRHLTSGPLIPAVYASCALPYLFTPEEIEGNRYWDGGFAEKTPLTPFLNDPAIEVVVVSYLPQRDAKKRQMIPFLPGRISLFADTPYEERVGRDRASVKLLKEAGKQVLVLAPTPLPLGPFSMEKSKKAFEAGRSGAREILETDDVTRLGSSALPCEPNE